MSDVTVIHCLQGAVIRRLSQHKTAISQKCVNTFASNFGSFTVPNLLLLAVFTQTTQKCNFQKRISQLNKVTHFQLNSGVTIQVCWDIFVAPAHTKLVGVWHDRCPWLRMRCVHVHADWREFVIARQRRQFQLVNVQRRTTPGWRRAAACHRQSVACSPGRRRSQSSGVYYR